MDGVTKDIERLAQALSAPDRRGVLLLGFDATAALLGHAPHHAIKDEHGGGRRKSIEDFVADEVSKLSTPLARSAFLKRISQPADRHDVERPPVQVMAEVVKKARLGAIVAMDPGGFLHHSLRGYDLQPHLLQLDAAESDMARLTFTGNLQGQGDLFVDAGGIVLRGYRSGVYRTKRADVVGQRVKTNQQCLEEFVGKFDDVYVWGWCEANVDLVWVCADNEEATIHRIGAHTEVDRPNRSDFECYDDLGSADPATAWADTNWWSAVATLLRIEPTTSARPRRKPGARRPTHRPPVTDTMLANLMSTTTEHPLCVIGHPDPALRRGVARWLSAQDFGDGLDCVPYETEDLLELGRLVILQTGCVTGRRVVACLHGVAGPADDWSALLTTIVTLWLERPEPQRCPVMLLCPPEMSQWASDQWGDKIWRDDSLTDTAPGLPEIHDWLRQHVTEFGFAITADELHQLAEHMAGAVDDDVLGGLLHAQLDHWAGSVADRFAAGPGGWLPSVIELIDIWDTTFTQHRGVTQKLLDATFRITPLEIDFELGPIRPLKPAEEDGIDEPKS